MGWGLVRVLIVSISFLAGLMVVGPLRTSARSATPDVLRVNDSAGGSLIIACKGGEVEIKHVAGEPGAVELECSQGKVVVIRDRRERVRPLPVRPAKAAPLRFD
jgi:hypothetical protein